MKIQVLILIAGALWLSATAMFAIGWFNPDLAILRWAAIPDAIGAIVFSVLAANRWSRG